MTERIPLYRRALGTSFDLLPGPIRAMHDVRGTLQAEGRADITRGTHPLARLVAGAVGLPPAGRDVPVRVTLAANGVRETWSRSFDGVVLRTRQWPGRHAGNGEIVERVGPAAFALALTAAADGLSMEARGCRVLGVPLPAALAPRVDARESVTDGMFAFDVRVALPWIGPVIRYRGTLRIVANPAG